MTKQISRCVYKLNLYYFQTFFSNDNDGNDDDDDSCTDQLLQSISSCRNSRYMFIRIWLSDFKYYRVYRIMSIVFLHYLKLPTELRINFKLPGHGSYVPEYTPSVDLQVIYSSAEIKCFCSLLFPYLAFVLELYMVSIFLGKQTFLWQQLKWL